MSSQLRKSLPYANHDSYSYASQQYCSVMTESEPLLIDVPDETDDLLEPQSAVPLNACVASSDEVDSTIGCATSGKNGKPKCRKDSYAKFGAVNGGGGGGGGGPDSRCSEVSSESSLHNNIFEYLSGLGPAGSADAAASSTVTRTVLHVTETYQYGLLTNSNTIVINDDEDQYQASYDIQASVDEHGYIDVPIDFAPKLLDQDCGDIFDISDKNFTISRRPLQQQQQQQAIMPAASSNRSCSLLAWAAEAARADADLSYLRRAAFRLITCLLPQLELRPEFDCTTRSTDRLLIAACRALGDPASIDDCRREFFGPRRRKKLRHRRLAAVSLCSQPNGCLVELKCRIVRLLKLLLPDLVLPASVSPNGSSATSAFLSMLIDRVVKHSRRRRFQGRR